MESFKFGNGIWATKTGSSIAYNDENGNYKPLPFSVTRGSSATRVNRQGLIESVSNDKLRIDFKDSSKGVALLEPSRTNSQPYSEQFDDSNWGKTNLSVSANQIVSPDGSQNADKLTENSSTGEHRVQDSLSLTSGVDYTFSVFVKDNGRGFIRLRLENAGIGSGQINAFFDLQNATTPTSNASIINYGNGWYRCIATGTTNTTSYISKINLADSVSSVSYTGDNNSGVYLWGAMIEQGSYPTSYIPTSGSSVTRSADVANGAGNSNVFNDSQGVLFADIAALVDDNTSRRITINDGSANNHICIDMSEYTNTLVGRVRSSNVEYAFMTAAINQTLNNKIVLKYKLNDVSLWLNGYEVATDTSATMPIGLSELEFEGGNSLRYFYGKTKRIAYFDEMLTDAELETLTSYTSFTEMANELNLTIK